MKKKIISLVVALALAVTAALGTFPSLHEDSVETAPPAEELIGVVEINEKNFPDENFRNYVTELEASAAEGEADGILSADELANITAVSVSSRSIKSLKGIEFFTFLEELDCSYNPLTELDLSGNPDIRRLNCSYTMLTSLNLEGHSVEELEAFELSGSSYTILSCNDGSFDFDLSSLPGDFDFSRVSNLKIINLNDKPEETEEETGDESVQETQAEEEPSEEPSQETEAEEESAEETSQETEAEEEPAEESSQETEAEETGEGTETEESPEETKQEDEESLESLLRVSVGDVVTYTYDVGCGLSAEFMIVFRYGHNLIAVDDRSSVCTSAEELWQCVSCGKYFVDENGETEAVINDEHIFDEGVTEVEATCTSGGVIVNTCTLCGYEVHEETEKLPHTPCDEYESDYCHHWKLCSVCGEIVGEKEEHIFEEGSNTCSVCGKTFEHRHQPEFVEEKAPTCTEEGMKAHYYCAECGKYFEDSECTVEILSEDLIIEKTDHQYELKYNDTEHWEQCVICEDKRAPEAHELEVTETKPSCCKEGSVTTFCHVCGYIESVEVIPATGEHNFGTEYGMDDESHWLACTTEDCTEKIAQTEHSFTKLEIVKEPTCAEEGIMNHICEVCGYCRPEPIETVDRHTYGDLYEQVDELTHIKLCTVCGEHSETEAHEFDEGAVIKEATCEAGIIRYTCVCGYYKDEIIPAETYHDFTEFIDEGEQHRAVCSVCGEFGDYADHDCSIEIVNPSCIESGKMVYTCKDCGHVYEKITSEPTGVHSFSSEFTLDGGKHVHKCEIEGCDAVDVHEADKCEMITDDDSQEVPSDPDDGDTISDVPVINVTWPTTAGVVLNPYKMKVKIDVSEGKPVTVTEDAQANGDTVLSNELSFINNGTTEVNISVTGSVSAVTTVDKYGNALVDSEGNPTTEPSKQIVIAGAPIEQPVWSDDGTKIIAGDSNNSVLLYLEVASEMDPTGKNGVYTGAYDSKNSNQMLLGTESSTKTLFNIAAMDGDKAGVTNIKICGDVSTAPAVGWDKVAKTDSVQITLAFEASLAVPLTEQPAAEEEAS